jgi:hypothetical protein
MQSSGDMRREKGNVRLSAIIGRSESDEASRPFPQTQSGLLCSARNDGG